MVEQNLLSKILDSLNTAIIVLRDDLTITHMNAAAENLLSVSGEQMLDKTMQSCFAETDNTPYTVLEAYRSNENFTKRKVVWKLHNQSSITVDYSVTPNREEDFVVLEVQPLDRLLRINKEEAWIASQETSRNLVRSMAHEIKNPLGGIRGAAQLLSRELQNSDYDEYTRVIIDETDRLRNLTDRMLGPRRLPDRKPVNVHEVLQHVFSVIRMEADSRIKITKDYDPSIPDLLGDKEQLIQATLNIVRNALEALVESATESPEIKVATRVQRRYTIGRENYPLVAQIKITDNGPGVPETLIENIFFPMITGRATGTGLGLSISQNLIGQHSGLIECESTHGCTEFVIYLPLGSENANAK